MILYIMCKYNIHICKSYIIYLLLHIIINVCIYNAHCAYIYIYIYIYIYMYLYIVYKNAKCALYMHTYIIICNNKYIIFYNYYILIYQNSSSIYTDMCK